MWRHMLKLWLDCIQMIEILGKDWIFMSGCVLKVDSFIEVKS